MKERTWVDTVFDLLNQRGMSQADLARLMRVHHTAVSYWLRGKRRLRPPMRRRMARALHRTQAELFEKEKP